MTHTKREQLPKKMQYSKQ